MFTMKLTGMDALKRQCAVLNAINTANSKMQKEFHARAKEIADDMQRRAPLGPTGNLRRSIHAHKYKAVSIVAVDRIIAPHAGLVEFGSSARPRSGVMPAHPYFRPAIDAAKGVKDIIEKNILEAVK